MLSLEQRPANKRELPSQEFFESIEKHGLIGMDLVTRFRHRKKAGLVDLPRGTARSGVCGSGPGKRVHPLAAFLIANLAKLDEIAGHDTGFLERLPPRRRLQVLFIGIGLSFRNAPRLAAIVVA